MATLAEKIQQIRDILAKDDGSGDGSFRFLDLEAWIGFLLEQVLIDADTLAEKMKVRTLTGNTSLDSEDRIILANGIFNITMPSPSDFYDSDLETSLTLRIKNIGLGAITLLPNDSETIEATTLEAGESFTIVTNGTDWFIV